MSPAFFAARSVFGTGASESAEHKRTARFARSCSLVPHSRSQPPFTSSIKTLVHSLVHPPFRLRELLSCSNFSLGVVDVTPTASARKTWLTRSTGSPFARVRLWNSLVWFHFAFCFCSFICGFYCVLRDLVRYEPWFLERLPRLLGTPEPSATPKPISFAGTLAAATGYAGALGYTEAHLVRPEQALSRPLIPNTCLISGTGYFAFSCVLRKRTTRKWIKLGCGGWLFFQDNRKQNRKTNITTIEVCQTHLGQG